MLDSDRDFSVVFVISKDGFFFKFEVSIVCDKVGKVIFRIYIDFIIILGFIIFSVFFGYMVDFLGYVVDLILGSIMIME